MHWVTQLPSVPAAVNLWQVWLPYRGKLPAAAARNSSLPDMQQPLAAHLRYLQACQRACLASRKVAPRAQWVGIIAAPAHVLDFTLSDVQACLHDMLPQDRPEASKPSLWNCWRPKPPAHAVNEEELDKAAEYVVSRFGVYSDDEEESDDEDEWEGGKVGRSCCKPC